MWPPAQTEEEQINRPEVSQRCHSSHCSEVKHYIFLYTTTCCDFLKTRPCGKTPGIRVTCIKSLQINTPTLSIWHTWYENVGKSPSRVSLECSSEDIRLHNREASLTESSYVNCRVALRLQLVSQRHEYERVFKTALDCKKGPMKKGSWEDVSISFPPNMGRKHLITY